MIRLEARPADQHHRPEDAEWKAEIPQQMQDEAEVRPERLEIAHGHAGSYQYGVRRTIGNERPWFAKASSSVLVCRRRTDFQSVRLGVGLAGRIGNPWYKSLFYQRINAVPQARPAPKPLRTSRLAGWTRPSATASSRARGTDPAEVLP